MSIFIQEVLGLLKRNQKKITLDKTKDWFEFGKLYQTSVLNTGASYNPKMDPFVIKWGDLVCQATEDLTRTLPGEGKLGYVPVYTDPSGFCSWDTLKDSIITQNSLNTIITIGGNLVVTGDAAINGGDLTSTASNFSLLHQSTTIGFGYNSTSIFIGGISAISTVVINGTQDSSSCTTGAFRVNGGVGIAKNLHVCGDTYLNGYVYLGDALADEIALNGTLLDNNGTASLINQALVGMGDGSATWQNVALVGEVCAVNSIPLWTPNASTLGCSLIYQNGNNATPATKIFLKGGLASEGSEVRTISDVAIGTGNYAGGENSAAFNYRSSALGNDSFALGHKGIAGGHGSFAAGYNTGAGNYAFGYFNSTVTSTTLDIFILSGTMLVGDFIVANVENDPSVRHEILTIVGTGGIGLNTITIATPISVNANEAVAIEEAVPNRGDSSGSIALGVNTASKGQGAIAIGTRAATDIPNEIAIGSSSTTVKLDGTVNDNVPNKLLVIDSSNVVRWRDVSTITATITANNGLTMSTASNVQLGGTLLQNTTISGGLSTAYDLTLIDGDLILSKGSGISGTRGNLKIDNDRNIFWGGTNHFISGSSVIDELNYSVPNTGTHNFSSNIKFRNYGAGTKTGTAAYNLSVTSTGNVIETLISGGLANGTAAGNTTYWNGTQWVVNSNNIFNNGNNVGIGITTPLFKLSVSEDSEFNGIRVGKGAGNIITNTAVGNGALSSITTGSLNTALGNLALNLNSTGNGNTAIGVESLRNNTGSNNTAIGLQSAQSNTTGFNNIAVGSGSLQSNTTGTENVAIGVLALNANVASSNTAVGTLALTNNTTGSSNVAMGKSSLQFNTTGLNNIAIGVQTLLNNTTGSNNLAIGISALATNTASVNNIAIGTSALQFNTANQNLAIGHQALQSNTTGTQNVAIGQASLSSNTTAINNTAVGFNALQVNDGGSNTAIGNAALTANTTGTLNVAVGSRSLVANTTGNTNTAIGTFALTTNTTGSNNIAIGFRAADTNQVGNNITAIGTSALQNNIVSDNTAVGSSALFANTTGTSNIAVGSSALVANTTGTRGIAIGSSTLTANTTGSNNIAIGNLTLNANTTGAGNIALGYLALQQNNSDRNIAIGVSALRFNTGNDNIALGNSALSTNTTGTSSVAIGSSALTLNTTGGSNVAIGRNNLNKNTTGSNNTAIGSFSMLENLIGANNVAVGVNSLQFNLSDNNTAVGNDSFRNLTTGTSNVAIGYSSARQTSTITSLNNATDSIFIGRDTKANADSETNQIVIGADAVGLGSNSVVLGHTNVTKTQLRGDVISGNQTALATNATTGFLHIPTCAGTPTGTPALYTGKVPLVFDSTNGILYIYSGGSWIAI